MKLFYVSNGRIPSRRAYSVQMVKMCEAFAETQYKGHKLDVTFVTANSKHQLKDNLYDYYGVKRNFRIVRCPTLEIIGGNKVTHVLQQITLALTASIYTLWKRPDVIFSRDDFTSALLSTFTNKVVYEIHTKRPLPQVKWALRHARALVTISQGLKDYYVKEHNVPEEKILVAHDAVSPERFESELSKNELRALLNLPLDRPIVGHLGKITTMGKGKGVEELIAAFPAVLKKFPTALLLLAGVEEHEKEYIEELCVIHHIHGSQKHMVGHVPQKDFPPYFLVCDALVMAYPDTEHYHHFMSPIKLFEYMASGVPMVTTDLPVVREVLDETMAVFVKPDSAESMAHGVQQILDHSEVSFTRAEKAQNEVQKKYTWQKRADDIVENTVKISV